MAHPFDIFRPQVAAVIGLLFILVIFVTMVYGPIAAMLVELFPTKIRYTSMSLPYHIGNGWFGGLLPATAFAIVASTGDIYAGLWYPIIFAAITVVVGFFFLPETKDVDISDELTFAGGDSRRGTIDDKPAAERSAAGFVFSDRRVSGCADELQHDLAAMRPGAMLDQVDRLPGAERELAVQHRDLQRGRRQHGLDMRRHVVGAFGVVASSRHSRGASRSSAVIRSTSTDGSAFSWIVSDAEVWRMNSVTAPSRAPASRDEFCDLGGEIDEAGAGRLHRQQRRHDGVGATSTARCGRWR